MSAVLGFFMLHGGCTPESVVPAEPTTSTALKFPDGVDAEQLKKLTIGMTPREVASILDRSPVFAPSFPALYYLTKRGGCYYFVFYDESKPESSQEYKLRYIIFFRDGFNIVEGQYVLPVKKRGQKYTMPIDRRLRAGTSGW